MKKLLFCISLLFCSNLLLAETITYPSLQALLRAEGFSESDDPAFPWHQDHDPTEYEEDVNYQISYSNKVPFSPNHYLLFLSPEWTPPASGQPSYIYLLQRNQQAMQILYKQPILGRFDSIEIIGPNKGALHLTDGYLQNGYMDYKHYLYLLNSKEFYLLADWNGDLKTADESLILHTQYQLDRSQNRHGLYPLKIHVEKTENGQKSQQDYLIQYDPQTQSYPIPPELQQGF